MPTCNLCGENKSVDDMQGAFHYVCKICWEKLEIFYKENGRKMPIDKNNLY